MIGQYNSQIAFGQSRVLLVWTRLLMPNGRSIVLERQPGTDAARMSSLVASRAAVQQLLAELPERYRDAVTLRDVERLPYAEVATRLGRNVNTVKSHVARGRALLAALLVDRGLDS